MRYIDHTIIDQITHQVKFEYTDDQVKIRTIEYLSIYSNTMLIRNLFTIPVTFQGREFTAIVMECRCDLKAIKSFINYLVN